MLRSVVATADAGIKSTFVEALIGAFATDSVNVNWRTMRDRYHALRHQGLEVQLANYLIDTKLGADTVPVSAFCVTLRAPRIASKLIVIPG